jgi:hypothetical protein
MNKNSDAIILSRTATKQDLMDSIRRRFIMKGIDGIRFCGIKRIIISYDEIFKNSLYGVLLAVWKDDKEDDFEMDGKNIVTERYILHMYSDEDAVYIRYETEETHFEKIVSEFYIHI